MRRSRQLPIPAPAALLLLAAACSAPRPTAPEAWADGERSATGTGPDDARVVHDGGALIGGPFRPVVVPRHDVEEPGASRRPGRARRTRSPRPASEPNGSDAVARALTRTLDEVTLRGSFEDVVGRLRTLTGVPIVTTPAAREHARRSGFEIELVLTAPLAVHHVLDHLAAVDPTIGWSIADGAVVFDEASAARGALVRQVFDVRDLVAQRTDFIAPEIGRLPVGDETYGRTGGEGSTRRAIEPGVLLDLVRLGTDPEYWRTTDGASLEILDSGYLIAVAHRDVQRRIGRALRER